MASKPTRGQGGIIRTYGRLRPVRRLQPQHWLSPAERGHLFSSSSSSSLFSSSYEPSSSSAGDSDYRPKKSKQKTACKGRKQEPKLPSHRCKQSGRRKKGRVKAEIQATPLGEEKENGLPPERNASSSHSFSTPFRKFVTVRRKVPVLCVPLKPCTPRREKDLPVSPDSTCDFDTHGPRLRRKRKLCTDIISILNSPMDALHSPLHKQPLLSSTPSVRLRAPPRARDPFLNTQLALSEALEESVVVSCPEAECPPYLERISPSIEKQSECPEIQELDSCRTIHLSSINIGCEREVQMAAEGHCNVNGSGAAYHDEKMELQLVQQKESILKPRLESVVKGIEVCRKSNRSSSRLLLSSLSPIMISSSESHSVTCVDGGQSKASPLVPTPSHEQNSNSVFCVSAELFSNSDINEHSRPTRHEEVPGLRCQTEEGYHQLANKLHIKSCKADTQVCMSSSLRRSVRSVCTDTQTIKIMQPFVRLNSQSVTEYLNRNRKSISLAGCSQVRMQTLEADNKAKVPQCRVGNQDKNTLSDTWLRTMQPIVRLDSNSVAKYFLKRSNLSANLQDQVTLSKRPELGEKNLSEQSFCPYPALQAITRTPDLAASQVRNKMQISTAPRQEAVGTGRKVCINGFSAKRWGKPLKKSTKAQQQLSFRDGEMAMRKLKKDSLVCSARSPSSLLFSSSLLSSSFMNSSAILNLSLSPETFSLRDPQRDQRDWMRLRAALSLHRKKKVEATLQSGHPVDRSGLLGLRSPMSLNCSLASQSSSILLLSSRCMSPFSDELTDAEKVFMECQQDCPVPFSSCLNTAQLACCEKVGEGAYGEVFRTLRGGQQVALKVIPIEGSRKVNGEDQKSFSEILPEIIISKELSLLSDGEENRTSGFIRLHSSHCVKGTYPLELLQAWDKYAEEKGTENERPDLFGAEQLFMILEFEFGGSDLESCQLPSVTVSYSILHQVTAALAVAEEELRFEHRDLHWGNLLIEKCVPRSVAISLRGDTIHIPTSGVQVKIIDYTLSRLDKDGLTVFCDLSTDEALFLGTGDLQFEVYRSMRQENQNIWSSYHPRSNILWLHYLSDKLLRDVHYLRKPSPAVNRREIRKLQDFRREICKFHSAAEALQSKLFR